MNHNRIIKYELILALLKESSHGRALADKLKVPLTTVQRNLKMLKEENVFDIKISGKNKIYSLKRNLPARVFVFNSENYKLLKVIGRYPLLEPVIEELRKMKSELIVLFGSYAKEKAKADSDIDVYIETENRKIKKEAELVNSKLSVKIGKFDLKSNLINEIIKSHVIVCGVERFYERLGFFEQAEKRGEAGSS
jgi:predicted nucleotidyltransferase